MPIQIVRNDITKMQVDAFVNAAKKSLLGGGGVDGAIHRAAGRQLLAECWSLGGCEVGDAKMTGAYRLPCKHIIHTVGPVWQGGHHGEREKLASCYRRSLALAKEAGCETVAFPLISAGTYGYPKDQALRVAIDTIGEFLSENDMTVYLVIYDKDAYLIGEKLFADIKTYIDDRYVEAHSDAPSMQLRRMQALRDMESETFMQSTPSMPSSAPSMPSALQASVGQTVFAPESPAFAQSSPAASSPAAPSPAAPMSLDDAVKQLDESFSEMLLRKIDEKGMTDAQCYKKANIDRKLFSKIRSDRLYKPSKPTALAFAIALELPLEEAKDMLMKAGFALSHSNKFDIIIEYFIEHGNYNIFEINEALFAFDQSLLGA